MKKKNKVIPVLLTGIALAIGIAISNAVIQNSFVLDEAKAAPNDQLAKFDADVVVNDSGYKKYEDANWLLTFGGNNLSAGTNSDNRSKCVLGSSNVKYSGDSGVTSSNIAYAIASKTTLSKVGKVVFAHDGGSNNTRGIVFLTSSSDGSSYSKIALSTGTGLSQQGSTISSSMTFEFSMISSATYYAIVVKDSGSSGAWRFDRVTATFYEGAPLKQLQSLSIVTPPAKTSYFVGESLSTSGLVIQAAYDVGDPVNVTSSCTFNPSTFSEAGSNISVTASYTDNGVTKTASIEGITVVIRNLVSIAVSTNPTKVAYVLGESFNPTGMVITATYDAGDPLSGYTNYDFSPSTFTVTGPQEVTIFDKGNNAISTTITVNVSEAPNESVYTYSSGDGTGDGSVRTYDAGHFSMTHRKNSSSTDIASTYEELRVYTAHSMEIVPKNSGTKHITSVEVTASSANYATAMGNATILAGTNSGSAVAVTSISSVNESVVTFNLSTVTDCEFVKFTLSAQTRTLSWKIVYTVVSAPQHEQDAVAYGTSFLSATASGCSTASSATLSGVWADLETSYNALSSDAKAYLSSLTPNASGNDAEHAVARYIHIITKYGEATFVDFMNLDIQAAPTASDILDISGNDFLPLISVIGIIGLTVIIGYYYHNKKKEA